MGMIDVRRRVMLAGMFSEQTAQGNPLQFTTNLAKPLKSLVVPFSPVQSGSGDPSPSNVRSITGWTGVTVSHSGADTSNPRTYPVTFPAVGKNLLNDSKRYIASATTVYVGSESNTYDTFLKAGTYTVSVNFDGNKYGLYCRSSKLVSHVIWYSGTGTTQATFTLQEDDYYTFWVYRGSGDGGVDNANIKWVQIEKGSSATAYEPFTTTVYGGEIDPVAGTLTITQKSVRLLGVPTGRSTTYVGSFYYSSNWFSGNADMLKPFICNRLKYVGSQTSDFEVGTCINANGGSFNLWVRDTEFSTNAEVASWLEENETYICFYLTTPLVIPLSPTQIQTLVGQNTIWTDTNGSNTAVYLKR